MKKSLLIDFLTIILIFSLSFGSVFAYTKGYNGYRYAHKTEEGLINGLDISSWQDVIPVSTYKKFKEAGVEFVILRSSFTRINSGNREVDPCFEQNYKNAKEAGLDIGIYHYSCAKTVTQAQNEALYTLKKIIGKKITYPVYIDVEDPTNQGNLSKATLANVANAYCKVISNAGYKAGVYASLSWFKSKIGTIDSDYTKWVAQYPVSGNTTKTVKDEKECAAKFSYDIWQYSSEGKISPFKGKLDCNFCYKNFKTGKRVYSHNYPVKLDLGKGFDIYGTVASNKSIKSVKVQILDKDGKIVQSETREPGEKTYSLSKISNSIKFSKLKIGTYKYRLKVKDSVGEKTLINKSFKVATDSKLKIDSTANYPTKFFQGESFSIKGKVSSNYKISSLYAKICDEDGTVVYKKTASPNTTSYSLSKLASSLKFKELPKGKYTYTVWAKDSKINLTLLKKDFRVYKEAYIKAVNFQMPQEIEQGNEFTMKGKISSNYYLRNFKVWIRYESGTKKGKYRAQVTKDLSNNLSSNYVLDKYKGITFTKLPKGKYKLIIKASVKPIGTTIEKTLYNKYFTVV
ncbi:MAG: glycoside hydrolase family 25 protein [Clostridia bacterium]|nr:glycoside hydrolase family 25 protein [Clostridia bacterium]